MTASNADRRTGVSSSQRPTVEMQEDDSLEIETLPPHAAPSEPPISASHRATVPGSSPISQPPSDGGAMPVELEARLIVGLLRALVPLHTNLRVTPRERAYARVCYQNALIEPDGSVRLRPLDEAVALPKNLVAPEVALGAAVDQQADLYAVGVLLLGLVQRHLAHGGEDSILVRLRAVAQRAIRLDPGARWTSAAEFAEEVEHAMGARLPSADALALFTRDQQARLEALTRAEIAAVVPAPALPRGLSEPLGPAPEEPTADEALDRPALPLPFSVTWQRRSGS